jgi:predicted metal-dependent HD superfamily phosphohydrolase
MYRLYPRANEPGNQHEPDGMDPDDFNAMQLAWGRLLERYRVAAAEAMPVFRVLAQAYQSVGRYYHTLEHLEEMLRVAGRLMAITDDPRALQLAIWFHDAVYDPRGTDNEARSADLAVSLLGPIGVPRSDLDIVARLIHATAHIAYPQPPVDRETAILLDADLAILGSPPERYDRYAADIRKEYAWVPENDYRKARAKVLEHFLGRPRLFWNDSLHADCDGLARRNLQRELATM